MNRDVEIAGLRAQIELLKGTTKVLNCLYCNTLIRLGKGVGTNSAYCRVECWFSAAADEHSKAYTALMALERPAVDVPNVLAKISAEILSENPEIEGYFGEEQVYEFSELPPVSEADERSLKNAEEMWQFELGERMGFPIRKEYY